MLSTTATSFSQFCSQQRDQLLLPEHWSAFKKASDDAGVFLFSNTYFWFFDEILLGCAKLEFAMLKTLTILGASNTLVFGVLTLFADSDKFANNLIATMFFGAFTAILVTTKMMSSNRENVDLSKQSWPNDVGGGSGF